MEELRRRASGLTLDVHVIKTTGDRMQDVSLAQIGGKGAFVKELEEALKIQRTEGGLLGEILIRRNMILPHELMRALCAQIGMTFEADPEHVMGLTLIPVRGRPDIGDCLGHRIFAG